MFDKLIILTNVHKRMFSDKSVSHFQNTSACYTSFNEDKLTLQIRKMA